ncbi:hypothetical protein DHEL01_v202819 [Diaporthe helianthi]|uniref:Glucose-methanol-choline oxidoreductase N-terminal domain-containing protein n=1 Tax=Diaporthe helianthi TaxID=158607 RepID=A0A2P5I8H5_DIAHE|nr:hypothetical protein DHEL01_v202819 [Diaporthe helianthi]
MCVTLFGAKVVLTERSTMLQETQSKTRHNPASAVTAEDFCDSPFDFLIVGGGTAGLAVAARLSEKSSLRVGVLEAGPEVEGNEHVDVPGWFGSTLGTELDWQFETTAQTGLGGRPLVWNRGKGLGGTSLLNFMTWNRAIRQDYDAWEKLGCKGWGWDSLLPFFKKSESFHAPSEDTKLASQAYYDPDGFGMRGPIDVSYATEYSASHQYWHKTLQSLGIHTNESHMTGSNVGAWTNLGLVNPRTCTRASSATAYYQPHRQRANLVVLSEAFVNKLIIDHNDGSWVARGVEFIHKGLISSVFASKEVIICAGTVQSPQILELSGIGNPDVLRRAGIETLVPSPFVGENLQDHIMAASIYEVASNLPSPDDLKTDTRVATAAREEFNSKGTGPLTILSNSICYLSLLQIMSGKAFSRLAIMANTIQDDFPERSQIRRARFDTSSPRLGQIEYIFDLGNWNPFFHPDHASSGKKYGTMLQILQYPFSRGSIHIRSANPNEKPAIDPQYYQGAGGNLDLDIMVECAKFAEKVTTTPPISGIVHGRVVPPHSARTNVELRDWLERDTITDWHPIGTCGMGGDRGIAGGVVYQRLRVYGVKGLRVVDASIMPLQISAHLQATVYAIAEKGAHMILEDWQE